MERLLTLKEIAADLGVPESNLRYYRDRIQDFLPAAGRGRKRRYFPEATDVFRKTLQWLQEGLTLDRIYGLLATEDMKPEQPAPPAAIDADAIARAVADHLVGAPLPCPADNTQITIEPALNAIQELQGTIDSLRTEILDLAALREEVARLNERHERKDERIDALLEECARLRELIAEKDRILEEQKTRLLEIRTLRNLFLEEVRQLRSMVQTQQRGVVRPASQASAG